MLWYNEKTRTLQSNNPAGGWASASYMAKHFPNWRQVSDDFELPVVEAVVSKDEQLAALDAEYEAGKQELANAYLDAMLHSDTDLTESIKAELAELDAAYDANRKEIEGA